VSNPGSSPDLRPWAHRSHPSGAPARLLLAATPLGLPSDASARLISALGSADVVAAEDTRRVRLLAQGLGVRISGKVVSLFDQNEESRVPALVDQIRGGATVLVVSDAGMPVINDPGFRLVSACVDAGLPVSCLPGPSAVTTALAVSGLPADRFCFEGFPPRKHSARNTWLAGLAAEQRTAVFFESPRRLAACLQDAVEVLGPERRAVVCRELTKTHEEIRRGTLAELAGWAADGVLGEITVVLAGAQPLADVETLVAEVNALVDGGLRVKDACAQVVAAHPGAPSRRDLYDAVLRSRD
jgi:16S rRNA (cytidine1402-2'-O)-methyltransferase